MLLLFKCLLVYQRTYFIHHYLGHFLDPHLNRVPLNTIIHHTLTESTMRPVHQLTPYL